MTDNVSPDIKAQFLATCDFDILMRTDHPWLAEVNRDGTPDWSALKRYEKIETTIDSFGTRAPGGLDHWIFKGKLPEQHTALWCPYVQAATELLPESDLTMVVYSPLAPLGCGYPLGFLRHGRRDDDPALEWLRAVFVSCFNRKH